jgi:hypothetical protein
VSWWERSHQELEVTRDSAAQPSRGVHWEDSGTPDDLLHRRATEAGDDAALARQLATLGNWISDDSANADWGRPIDCIDLNDPRPENRVLLPATARPGDRFAASFDPGSRVWGEIVELDDEPDEQAIAQGRCRSRLGSTLETWDIHDVCDAGWAWNYWTEDLPIRLPGETAGGPLDPYVAAVEAEGSNTLYQWASTHGATAQELGEPWTTKADVLASRDRLKLMKRPGSWHQFGRGLDALVDGDANRLQEAIARLH